MFLTVALLAVFIATPAPAATLSACLRKSNGELYNVREAATPSRPCNPKDSVIQWAITGPAGPAGAAGPAGPAGPGGQSLSFVGLTSALFDGSAGVSVFNQQCNGEFKGSRFCTSEEFMKTVNPPPLGGARGWIHPVIVSGDNVNGAVDFTGRTRAVSNDFSCKGWTTNAVSVAGSAVGPTITGEGGYQFVKCSFTIRAACCR